MQTEAYQAGVAGLEAIATECPTAFLCAERLPSACHRRFVAETLRARGWEIVHILEVGQVWTPDIPEVSSSEPSLPGVLDGESKKCQ